MPLIGSVWTVCRPDVSASTVLFPPPGEYFSNSSDASLVWNVDLKHTDGLNVIDKLLWHLCFYDWADTMACMRHLPRRGFAVKPHVALPLYGDGSPLSPMGHAGYARAETIGPNSLG